MHNQLLIVADANPRAGMRHLQRAFSVAKASLSCGDHVSWLVDRIPATFLRELQHAGVRCIRSSGLNSSHSRKALLNGASQQSLGVSPHRLSQVLADGSFDWLILDGATLGGEFQSELALGATRLLWVADGSPSGGEAASLIVLQNTQSSLSARFPNARIVCGSEFLLSGMGSVKSRKPPAAQGRRILVVADCADRGSWALGVVATLEAMDLPSLVVDLIVSAQFNAQDELERLKKVCAMDLRVHRRGDGLGLLHQRTDLALVGNGRVSGELAQAGVPTVDLRVRFDEVSEVGFPGVMRWEICLGGLPCGKTARRIKRLLKNQEERQSMSEMGKRMSVSKAASRVYQEMRSMMLQLRPATLSDTVPFLTWRNDPEVRAMSFESTTVQAEAYREWLAKKLVCPETQIFVAETRAGKPLGQVRFETLCRPLTGEVYAAVRVVLGPESHGRGVGEWMIREAMDRLGRRTGIETVIAEVKRGDHVSARAFEGAGFTRISPKVIKGCVANRWVKSLVATQSPVLRAG